MSRAWIAFYMGDYLKKTQRLTTEQHGAYMLLLIECWQMGRIPLDDESRAAIARMPLARWNKIKAAVQEYFDGEGKNQRATEEIEKAERVSIKRSIAGQKGGKQSSITKAIARGEIIKRQAIASVGLKQTTQQTLSNSVANHNSNITTTSLTAEEPLKSARSLATAPLEGALTREPQTTEAAKRPAEMSRAELDAMFAKRRPSGDDMPDIPEALRR